MIVEDGQRPSSGARSPMTEASEQAPERVKFASIQTMMQRSLKSNYLIENATKPIDIENLKRHIEGRPDPNTI